MAKTQTNNTTTPNEKISQAMSLVNEARAQKVESVKESLKENIDHSKKRVEDFADQTRSQYYETRDMTEKKLKDHPFMAVFAASLIGLLLGFIFGRKDR